ncbi:hypothetical protein [Hufsiella ginkgonis]|uniref:Uncharacterized protein n=1 Tax=Hufsiella ginkgonis TaxID=2695274 RepID=A0A7K1XTF2_9SPHI|nr:hypothetical protein [Hufsiella ginkgonis]MXV14293.1 hypothetical protein [Hufsiella ginkgonis]
MDFGVLVKVSRNSATFWYQAAGKQHAPLVVRDTNEVPLYFFVENNQFIFGSAARDRWFNHDPNAFGNYFEISQDPSGQFILHNIPKRAKQLLYYGIEQYLSHFLNKVLYKSESIESYRQNFPLTFLFDADLAEPERDLVEQLFTEAGYRNISVISQHNALIQYLRSAGFLEPGVASLVLAALDDTLYMDLYSAGAASPVSAAPLADQGADPRIRIMAGMILQYILDQNPFLELDIDHEVSAQLSFTAELLSAGGVIVTGDAELTDGSKHWFRINTGNVEERLQFYQDDLLVPASIQELIRTAGLNPDKVVVLLVSDEIKTSYFSTRLLNRFPHVRNIEPAHLEAMRQYVFKTITPIAGKQTPSPAMPPLKTVKNPEAPAPGQPSGPVPKPPPLPPQKPPLPGSKRPPEKPPGFTPPPLPPHKKT